MYIQLFILLNRMALDFKILWSPDLTNLSGPSQFFVKPVKSEFFIK